MLFGVRSGHVDLNKILIEVAPRYQKNTVEEVIATLFWQSSAARRRESGSWTCITGCKSMAAAVYPRWTQIKMVLIIIIKNKTPVTRLWHSGDTLWLGSEWFSTAAHHDTPEVAAFPSVPRWQDTDTNSCAMIESTVLTNTAALQCVAMFLFFFFFFFFSLLFTAHQTFLLMSSCLCSVVWRWKTYCWKMLLLCSNNCISTTLHVFHFLSNK